jgi:hypothetical protein
MEGNTPLLSRLSDHAAEDESSFPMSDRAAEDESSFVVHTVHTPMSFWFLTFYQDPDAEQQYHKQRKALLVAREMPTAFMVLAVGAGLWGIGGSVVSDADDSGVHFAFFGVDNVTAW